MDPDASPAAESGRMPAGFTRLSTSTSPGGRVLSYSQPAASSLEPPLRSVRRPLRLHPNTGAELTRTHPLRVVRRAVRRCPPREVRSKSRLSSSGGSPRSGSVRAMKVVRAPPCCLGASVARTFGGLAKSGHPESFFCTFCLHYFCFRSIFPPNHPQLYLRPDVSNVRLRSQIMTRGKWMDEQIDFH